MSECEQVSFDKEGEHSDAVVGFRVWTYGCGDFIFLPGDDKFL